MIDYDRNNIYKFRGNTYFINRLGLYDVFHNATLFIDSLGVTKIGLIQGYSNYEYPLWRFLNKEKNSIKLLNNHIKNIH